MSSMEGLDDLRSLLDAVVVRLPASQAHVWDLSAILPEMTGP